MIEIFNPNEQGPTDEEILSCWQMMSAPSQTRWDYGDNQAFYRKSDKEVLLLFRTKFLASTTNFGYWAREDDQIVGKAGVKRFTDSPREHCGQLGLGVREAYQRRGIGYQLVRAVLGRARVEGLQRIECSSFADNRAATGLLRKAGFREEGLRIGAIKEHGQLRDIREFAVLL